MRELRSLNLKLIWRMRERGSCLERDMQKGRNLLNKIKMPWKLSKKERE